MKEYGLFGINILIILALIFTFPSLPTSQANIDSSKSVKITRNKFTQPKEDNKQIKRLERLVKALTDSLEEKKKVDYYTSTYEIKKPEFDGSFKTYSFIPPDSSEFVYQMKPSYIDSIYYEGVNSVPPCKEDLWKTVATATGGAALVLFILILL